MAMDHDFKMGQAYRLFRRYDGLNLKADEGIVLTFVTFMGMLGGSLFVGKDEDGRYVYINIADIWMYKEE